MIYNTLCRTGDYEEIKYWVDKLSLTRDSLRCDRDTWSRILRSVPSSESSAPVNRSKYYPLNNNNIIFVNQSENFDEFITTFRNNTSQTIAHFGFSLFILSILFNGILSSEITTNIKVGEKYNYNDGEIFFEKIEEKNESNFNSIIGYFKVTNNEGKVVELNPEIRFYNQPIIITSEADIKTTLLEDKFLAMNIVKGNEYFNIRYQVKPFMLWIWISVLIISLGGLMGLFKKKYEK